MTLKEKAFSTVPRIAVEVPEWDATVYVRQMSGSDFRKYTKWITGDGIHVDRPDAVFIALTVTDEKGNRMFADDDIPQVDDLPYVIKLKLVRAADTLNDPGDLLTLKKN